MERRTKFIILILIALAILAFGIWYLFTPFFRTVQQPPALPNEVTPSTTLPPTSTIPTAGGSTQTTPTDVKRIQDQAGIFVARLGSGTNNEGFSGYTDVLINATPAYQDVLRAQQRALLAAHPTTRPYGILTRVVATSIVSATAGAPEMTFRVQAQQAEDAGDPTKPTAVLYKEATVTFQKQSDGGYLVSNVVWKDIQP